MEQLIKEAQLAARDMNPYVDVLYNAAKYFNAGHNISILEIGVRRGTSTRAIMKGLKERMGGGHLYSIDKDDRSNVLKDKSDWTFLLGYSSTDPSREGYKNQEVEWNKPIDILFIDGDHTYEGVKSDYEKYEPFVKQGGLIFMHDITHKHFGVKNFWKEIKHPKANLAFNSIGMGIVNKI